MKIAAVEPFVLHVPVTASQPLWKLLGGQVREQVRACTTDAFAEFFTQQAIHWVQPDVTRMAGLTEVLQVCETAHAFRLPVAPHAGDVSQAHA